MLALAPLLTFQEIESLLLRFFIATFGELINKDREIRLQQKYRKENSDF
jgi:hypothetical protein